MPKVCMKLTNIKGMKFVAVELDMDSDLETTCTVSLFCCLK